MSKKKDIGVLVKTSKKFLKPIADTGTYKERHGKHINVSFSYRGCFVKLTFPVSPRSDRAIKKAYAEVRRKLKHCGLEPPNVLKVKLITSSSDDEHLERFYSQLDSMENEMGDPYKQEGVQDYLKRTTRIQRKAVRKNITNQKPYKKKITYSSNGRNISYIRYYVWKTLFRRDDRQSTGYYSASKGEYDEADVTPDLSSARI